MPYFETIQEWTEESSLLIEARPTTTRITTKYTLHSPSQRPPNKKRKTGEINSSSASAPASNTLASTTTTTTTTTTKKTTPPTATPASSFEATTKASLTLKTYDPISGACLKYRTFRAAEVGRLIGGLGELGKGMAGLKGITDGPLGKGDSGGDGDGEKCGSGEDRAMTDAPAAAGGAAAKTTGAATESASTGTAAKSNDKAGQSGTAGGSSSGGGKKKKKGKK